MHIKHVHNTNIVHNTVPYSPTSNPHQHDRDIPQPLLKSTWHISITGGTYHIKS